MELTPEERRRIYEEERARVESEELRRKVYEEERAKLEPAQSKGGGTVYNVVSGTFVLVVAVVLFGLASNVAKENAKIKADAVADAEREQRLAEVKELTGRINELDSVQVQPGWTWQVDGEWDYVRGSVKNTGSKTARYWKVRVDFLNASGAVIDSDFTNSADRLVPGASMRFEIMHRSLPTAKNAQVKMEELLFEEP